MRYKASLPTAVLGLLFLAACDSSELVSPDPVAVDPVGPKIQLKTSDDEFARASRAEAPGFAGFYLDEDGTPVIRLVDTGKGAAARQYLASRLTAIRGERNGNAPRQPVFRPARYDFAQLKGWADGLTPMTKRGDVYSIDVDEKQNRVSVGVQDAAAIAAVRAEAARLGVPAAALHVQTQPKPEQRITLQQYHNPLYGGIQIAFGQYLCTLGFNATTSAGQSIFVTNSHCTPTYFGYDGGAIYQPTVTSGNWIGNEVADVGLWDCGGTCRWADAAYISHNGWRGVSQGVIARTPWASGGGPTTITETTSYRVVARYNGNAPVGTWLDKTGRTTGSTYGQVTASCVTIGNLVCQDVSRVYSAGGDSGSPVYIWLGGSDVQLQGILWGGPGNDYTTTYSSPLVNIEYDLGPLSNVCAPGYGC
jgi:hypothetical protein